MRVVIYCNRNLCFSKIKIDKSILYINNVSYIAAVCSLYQISIPYFVDKYGGAFIS